MHFPVLFSALALCIASRAYRFLPAFILCLGASSPLTDSTNGLTLSSPALPCTLNTFAEIDLMALTARLALAGPADEESEPESLLGSALSVIFPDDITNRSSPSPFVVCSPITQL